MLTMCCLICSAVCLDIACGEQETHYTGEDRTDDEKLKELFLRIVKHLPKTDFLTAGRVQTETEHALTWHE